MGPNLLQVFGISDVQNQKLGTKRQEKCEQTLAKFRISSGKMVIFPKFLYLRQKSERDLEQV